MHFQQVNIAACACLGSPHIVNREVHQQVIVGLAVLQNRLTTLDVLIELRIMFPKMRMYSVVGGSIKQPSGIRLIFRGVGSAVVKNMVDTRRKKLINLRFYLRKRYFEVIGQPRSTLGTH